MKGDFPFWRASFRSVPARMVKCLSIFFGLISLSGFGFGQSSEEPSIVWRLNSLESIGGSRFEIWGEPLVIDAEPGRVVRFDGQDDALVFDQNPLAGLSAFTLEVVFRPDPSGNPEQRFVHMQEVEDHRVLVETRLTQDGHWFLDTFLKSGEEECTLYAREFLHPVGEWFHAALIYQDGLMGHYVNGTKEMECAVNFLPMTKGRTSLGSRLNRVYWFKGEIQEIRVTPGALSPSQFSLR